MTGPRASGCFWTIRKGSAPPATGPGRGASAGVSERSSPQAKKRTKGRRFRVTVEWLLGHYDAHVDAVVPRHANGIEPLFAIYQKSFLPALEGAISRQRYALHPLFDQAKVRYVDAPQRFSPECEFANINTPADYERVSKLITKPSA